MSLLHLGHGPFDVRVVKLVFEEWGLLPLLSSQALLVGVDDCSLVDNEEQRQRVIDPGNEAQILPSGKPTWLRRVGVLSCLVRARPYQDPGSSAGTTTVDLLRS